MPKVSKNQIVNFWMEPTSPHCTFHPSIFFLFLTLIVTSAATTMLCSAIMTENWEYITWDKDKLISLEKSITNVTSRYRLEWLLDGQVARVVLKPKKIQEIKLDENHSDDLPALFFVPIHGGIWTFCITITAEQHKVLLNMGFPKLLCTNYLKTGTPTQGHRKMDWHHRMQNLSISCALVCLILLSSSALTGVFGVTKHQISAVLITGVMYLLAGTFATFSLIIIHFKRARSKSDCLNGNINYGHTVDGIIVSSAGLEKSYSLNKVNKYFEARIFSIGWSLYLGWGGAAMCILASFFWIVLSKIMRYNPINNAVAVL